VLAGALAGLVASYWLTRLMESCLLDVPTTDLATFVASATLLVGVGLLAAFIPSPRAAKLDPVRALASN
jgi:ABC-type antimicrobial peptide transport system permease subunit